MFKQGVAGVSDELLWVLRIKTGGGRGDGMGARAYLLFTNSWKSMPLFK